MTSYSTASQTLIKFRKISNSTRNRFSSKISTRNNFFTSRNFYMSSFYNSKSAINIFNTSKKTKISESTIYLPLASAKLIHGSNIFNSEKKKNKKLVINWETRQKSIKEYFLKFDRSLSAYNINEVTKNNKKKKEERIKQVKELHFDYDKKNAKIAANSFSGNNPNLLKNKILFVKNVLDYLYPRILVNRMKFIEKKNVEDIDNKLKLLKEKFKNDYYQRKIKTIEEIAKGSKYDLKGAGCDEAVKIKGNIIKLGKIFVNGKLKTKLAKNYDYYQ